MTRKRKHDDDGPLTLRRCTQGDLVAIVWQNASATQLNGTEQIVRVCSTARTDDTSTCFVELIDPETMMNHRQGSPELCGRFFNMFALDNDIEVLCVVEPSRHVRGDDEKRARVVDVNDPLQGKGD